MRRFRVFGVVITVILICSLISSLNVNAKTPNFKRIADKNHQEYEYSVRVVGKKKKSERIYMTKPRKCEFGLCWNLLIPNGIGFTSEKQTSKGYFDAFITDSNMDDIALKFPIKKNLSWKGVGERRKIISTKTNVKTKYKTFKNAVKVQIGKKAKKRYQYFVPNYGMVKETEKGKVNLQLARVGKQKHS